MPSDPDVATSLDANAPDLLKYLQRRLGIDDAGDALAEVMIAAWRRADNLPADAEQSRRWLFGIARNVVANTTRGGRRHSKLTERLRGVIAAQPAGLPADHGLEVRDAIARLPPVQAELVRLIHWDGFTVAAAGEILGIPASTARTRYQRARADLRAALSVDAGGTTGAARS